jgi:hypothetical protein
MSLPVALFRSAQQRCEGLFLGVKQTLLLYGRSDAIDPLPPSAIQSSCVAVFLFDQLVRAQQDRCRHIEAKRLGGLHIEHGLVFRSNFVRSSAAISLAKA